jgi:hypothetical protein
LSSLFLHNDLLYIIAKLSKGISSERKEHLPSGYLTKPGHLKPPRQSIILSALATYSLFVEGGGHRRLPGRK